MYNVPNDMIPVTPFFFSSSSQSWEHYTPSNEKKDNGKEGKFRLASFNVLHDKNNSLTEMFIQSPKRNEHMVQLIVELEADVVCLQEVTPTILTRLLANESIRASYIVSHSPETLQGDVKVHGNVMLSRLAPLAMYKFKFVDPTCNRKVIFGLFSLDGEQFLVGGMHTTAYMWNANIREIQMNEVKDVLNRSGFGNNVFMMGDLNLHHERENRLIEPYFVDMWKATHPNIKPATTRSVASVLLNYVPYAYYYFPPAAADDEEEAYTFDSITNTFIQYYVPFERRRMRLDRIIMKQGCPFIPVDKMHRFATKPVEEGSYLFTSDHYGLYIDMKVQPSKL